MKDDDLIRVIRSPNKPVMVDIPMIQNVDLSNEAIGLYVRMIFRERHGLSLDLHDVRNAFQLHPHLMESAYRELVKEGYISEEKEGSNE